MCDDHYEWLNKKSTIRVWSNRIDWCGPDQLYPGPACWSGTTVVIQNDWYRHKIRTISDLIIQVDIWSHWSAVVKASRADQDPESRPKMIDFRHSGPWLLTLDPKWLTFVILDRDCWLSTQNDWHLPQIRTISDPTIQDEHDGHDAHDQAWSSPIIVWQIFWWQLLIQVQKDWFIIQ